ncbi:MAG TPA: FAD-dependent oxidoreductase [Candidatus Aquilonibacter sp.]|jgi:glycine/D-amino acid oxidase-like deaminating enzyme|nr:FAD-dependent oxidoreductase [Candidatus Aquilonibacter sp.]
MKSKPHIAVIGAGAFGGWTALHLLELGAHVTLLDNWGPGNSRASSGGETRIMRGTYGPNQPYTALAARAFKLWGKYENRWKHQLLHRTGVLWMVSSKDDDYERGSLALLREEHIKFQQLSTAQMKKRWPQINFSDVRWGIFESECGYLDARVSCQMVVDAFTGAGGTYRQVAALADGLEDAPLRSLRLSDGSRIRADYYVFACGPWLGKLFPEAVGKNIQPTKQDIFFFGPPARDSRFTDAHLPVWGDHGKRFFYGIPGSDRRGFKVADDTRGAAFDPTNGERVVSPATLKRVREYLSFRFPAMKEAPLIETRVCQYEQTLDSDFIVDRHPHMENVWLLGGGSGHGFKHGPALGEIMAEMILKAGTADERWQLARFSKRRKS